MGRGPRPRVAIIFAQCSVCYRKEPNNWGKQCHWLAIEDRQTWHANRSRRQHPRPSGTQDQVTVPPIAFNQTQTLSSIIQPVLLELVDSLTELTELTVVNVGLELELLWDQ